jgi:hypothetical protein
MNPYSPPNQPYAQPPPQGWPQPIGPTPEDESHLNTLAICHYIYAGLLGLGGLLGLLYVAIGIVVASSTLPAGGHGGGPPPAAIGGLFAAFGAIFVLIAWGCAAAVAYSGVSLKRRQRRTLSFVVACVCCLNVPLGTALGVFTLVVLSRASVKALYDRVAYYGA